LPGKQKSSEPFVKGFIKNYAKVVDVSYDKLLAAFRRDFTADKRGRVFPKNSLKPVEDEGFLNQKTLKILAAILATFLFSLYIGFQIKTLFSPPPLTVFKPENGSQLKGPIISVEGKTATDTVVSINGELAEVDSLGLWRKKLEALPGKNTIEIKATSRRGKETKKEITIEVVDN
jgi:cytoskeletal protein RodZ